MDERPVESDKNLEANSQSEQGYTGPDAELAAAVALDDERERAKAIEDVIESAPGDFRIPDNLIPKLLLTLDSEDNTRDRIFRVLALKLTPEQIGKALPDLTKHANEKITASDLIRLVPRLPVDYLEQALSIAEGIEYESARVVALEGMAPYLPVDLQRRAMEIVAQSGSPTQRVSGIAGILRDTPGAATEEMLDQLASWPFEEERPGSRARYMSEAASALAECGRVEDAQKLTEEALQLIDGLPGEEAMYPRIFALQAEGDIHRALKEHERAIEAYDNALKVADESGQGYRTSAILLSLGSSYQAMGALEDAIRPLTRAAEAVSANTEVQARRQLRRIYQRLGRQDDAAEQARRILEHGHRVGADPIEFDMSRTLTPDIPCSKDELGFAPLAKALVDMLNNSNTKLPLAIALTAPWGGGKSSLMRQVECRLRDPGGESPANGAGVRRWLTIFFDAWKFHQSEQIWASLAKEIYAQAQKDMGPLRRSWFRAKLEWTRGQLPFDILITVALIGGGGLAGYLISKLANQQAAGEMGAFAGAIVSIVLFLAGKWKGLIDPFRKAIDRHQERQRAYQTILGVTAEAQKDIDALTRTLTKDSSSALAVFVDDLDRCSPSHVVAVVETINQIFNASEKRPCAFILGIDRDVIAASLEHEYKGMVECLEYRNPDLARRFGESFLEKIVQLTVVIPEPNLEGLTRLLSSVTGNTLTPEGDQQRVEIAEKAVQDAVEMFKAKPMQNPVEVEQRRIEIEGQLPGVQPEVIREAARRVRNSLLNTDSSDVARAEFELLKHLPRNPRTVKRFDNAFRLQLLVANNTPKCGLDFPYEEILALGRWVALHFGWPELANTLRRKPQLLEELERAANNEPTTTGVDLQEWDQDEELLALLKVDLTGKRVSSLPFDTFINIR